MATKLSLDVCLWKKSISEVFDQKLILSLSKSEQIRYHSIVLVELYRSMYISNESQQAYWPKIRKRHAFLLISSATDFLATFYILHMYYEKRLQPSDAAANEESNDVL